jgi:hypothetical protein
MGRSDRLQRADLSRQAVVGFGLLGVGELDGELETVLEADRVKDRAEAASTQEPGHAVASSQESGAAALIERAAVTGAGTGVALLLDAVLWRSAMDGTAGLWVTQSDAALRTADHSSKW